ncbi:hypothetical protein DTW90_32355 [Neorhizobium sp. P12A]|nr:hypothetical protein DTW90_32355 [Neorhizobium sp. P12A]
MVLLLEHELCRCGSDVGQFGSGLDGRFGESAACRFLPLFGQKSFSVMRVSRWIPQRFSRFGFGGQEKEVRWVVNNFNQVLEDGVLHLLSTSVS